jgi:hypothetical protein
MRQDEESCRPARDAEDPADLLDGLIAGDALIAEFGDELLAAQPPPRFGPILVIVPVHTSTPHRRSSGLFRDPNIPDSIAIFMPSLNPSCQGL